MTTPLAGAWQAALAAEHQAVFGYSLLGPQLSGSQLALAVSCSNDHEALRNATEAAMTNAGLLPVQSRADYPALYPVDDAAAALALAVRLENSCAAGWRWLFAVAARPGAGGSAAVVAGVVAAAQSALRASAVRSTQWLITSGAEHPTTPFPGVGEQ